MKVDRNKLHHINFDDIVSAGVDRDSPVAPGEILHDDFMEPLGLSAAALARALHVPPNRVTAIINAQRSVSADTALRLSQYFGTTSEFWVRLQGEYDLRCARRTAAEDIEREITPCQA